MAEGTTRRIIPLGVLALARQGRVARRMTDGRRVSAAAERNRDAILQVLRGCAGRAGFVLEVASGTGQHVAHFARHMPDHVFQPSDPDPAARSSVEAWLAAEGLPNIRPALMLDAACDVWPVAQADIVVCINMIHISPWAATEGLVRGAARVLKMNGTLLLYGPYRRAGRELEPSNAAFDASLRERDAAWGIRDLDAVTRLAEAAGFAAPDIVEMPANNLCVRYARPV